MSPLPKTLTTWLQEQGYGDVTEVRELGGGCISRSALLRCSSGERFFLKRNAQVPADFFSAEAQSLQLLARTGAVRVPAAPLLGEDFILLEYVEPGTPAAQYWEQLGESLAGLHQHSGQGFGLDFSTYCGLTLQPNPWMADGYGFYAEHRYLHQARLGRDQGLLERADTRRIERFCERLPGLIPQQAPALLHGDLWSGNLHTDHLGRPWLIDPALYYGWPEADLAMPQLFGGFDNRFLASYRERRPLEPGFDERVPLYNLYHLLNHLNLFGAGYGASIRHILQDFG